VGFTLVAENDVDQTVLGLMALQPSWFVTMKEWAASDRSGMPKKIGFVQNPETAPT
jgi:hypothetical protein